MGPSRSSEGTGLTARSQGKLEQSDYERLLEFRTAIRKFLKYSKGQAEKLGLTPTQHQLLLAVRGVGGEDPVTIGQIAECLLIRHHSAVELVDRAQAAGLVTRKVDGRDQRVVRLALTKSGAAKLEEISIANLQELARLTPELEEVRRAIAHVAEKTRA